ncbi:hypothetical protein NY78_3669 [Desulfovibrio sp. TomC]|nr:hypothetical protein NY78_3669 [Desulfovibrio sp. TomC]
MVRRRRLHVLADHDAGFAISPLLHVSRASGNPGEDCFPAGPGGILAGLEIATARR